MKVFVFILCLINIKTFSTQELEYYEDLDSRIENEIDWSKFDIDENASLELELAAEENTTSTSDIDTSSFSTDPTTTAIITTTNLPYQLDSTKFIWTEEGDGVTDSTKVVIVDKGYYIAVNVSGVALADGSFLLITAGESYSNESKDGVVFANTVKDPYTYLFKSESVYASFTASDDTSKFNVVFERKGEPPTTPPPTTTAMYLPTPAEDEESPYFTIYMGGKSLNLYTETLIAALETCLADMALQYCTDENIILTETGLTSANVVIDLISECPYSWSDRENCVAVTFKIPIAYTSSPSGDGYLLASADLDRMWVRYGTTNTCLKAQNLSAFNQPNVNNAIMWWAIGISLAIVAFIVLLLFLKFFSRSHKPMVRRRRRSDTKSIVSSNRNSQSSMSNHYLQEHIETPQLFEPFN